MINKHQCLHSFGATWRQFTFHNKILLLATPTIIINTPNPKMTVGMTLTRTLASNSSEEGYSWLTGLSVNIMGCAMIILPAAILIHYLEKSEKVRRGLLKPQK